jgi:hypothetical protein
MATDHLATGETRDDIQAAFGARRGLGADYEVLDAFVDRMDARIAVRVDQALAVHAHQQPVAPQHKGDSAGTWVAIVSLGCGIPITALAAAESGIIGMMAAWAGIATINLAHAIGRASRP